jgi:cytidyltransferase-like protein
MSWKITIVAGTRTFMKTGYIPGGFKPFTKGHYFLVERASTECDKIWLVVGQSDRIRHGEHPITNTQMMEVWKKFLIPVMPSNVEVSFAVSPISFVYKKLTEANADNESSGIQVIYGDDKDLTENFTEKKLSKYVPNLVSQNRVVLKPFSRTSNVNISGTMMRKYLQLGLREEFIDGLPESVQAHGNEIWTILGGEQEEI